MKAQRGVLAFVATSLSISLQMDCMPKLIEADFDDFITQVVAAEDQKDFRGFYKDLVLDHENQRSSKKEKDLEKFKKKVVGLQEQGKIAVEVKNPVLAADLKKVEVSVPKKKINRVFYRYGAYEQFLKNKAHKQKSIVAKTKSYIRDTGSKVTAWFGNLRKPKTATT